ARRSRRPSPRRYCAGCRPGSRRNRTERAGSLPPAPPAPFTPPLLAPRLGRGRDRLALALGGLGKFDLVELDVAGLRLEAERCERRGAVLRRFGGRVEPPAVRVIAPEPPGVKLELAAAGAGQKRARPATIAVAGPRRQGPPASGRDGPLSWSRPGWRARAAC